MSASTLSTTPAAELATDNPLLDEWQAVQDHVAACTCDGFCYRGVTARWPLADRYAWAIPNDEALDAIAELEMPVVELGAGRGYWAALLARRGVTIDAYDLCPPDTDVNDFHSTEGIGTYHPVARTVGTEVAADAGRDGAALLLVWPPYDTPMGYDHARAYIEAGGTTIVYVGEPWGGCTGDGRLHALLDACDEVTSVDIPQWDGMHDDLRVVVAPDTDQLPWSTIEKTTTL